MLKKLTSRKLWIAIAGVATGIAIALGANASDIQTVAGAVTAVVSAVAYIITEGRIDAEAVKNAVEGVQDGLAVLQDDDRNVITGFGGDHND